jgi:hypothetical protein
MVDQLNRRTVRRARRTLTIAGLAFASTAALASSAPAASPVLLGTADSFALLAGSTITNTGATTINGDIGLCCTGLATPGFGSVTQPSGALHVGPGSPAAGAQDDLDIAYANAAGQALTNTLPVDLSLTGTPANPLLPGVYESTSTGALQINTGLTLDFQGDPNAVFIFRGTDLTTAVGAGGSVNIVNGGSAPSACNIYWQLSDATQGVTLGTSSAFKGTTMALGASVLGTGATVEGRILTRRSKAVTLDTNTITRSACFAAPSSGGGGAPAATQPATPVAPGPITATTQTGNPAGGLQALPGSAQLTGPEGAVSGPFTVWVTGHAITSVSFSIDGKHVLTVPARRGRTKYVLKVNPLRQSRRVHQITARITFSRRSRTGKTTRRITYRRAPPALPPRFTG